MEKVVRIVVVLLGLLFLVSGVNWVLDPDAAAQGLGVALPDGLARSTLIGDLGAFFFAGSAFIFLGVVTARAHWLYAAAMLFGGAAVMRTLAWALHDAAFAAFFIAVEVVVTAILLFAATRTGQGNQ